MEGRHSQRTLLGKIWREGQTHNQQSAHMESIWLYGKRHRICLITPETMQCGGIFLHTALIQPVWESENQVVCESGCLRILTIRYSPLHAKHCRNPAKGSCYKFHKIKIESNMSTLERSIEQTFHLSNEQPFLHEQRRQILRYYPWYIFTIVLGTSRLTEQAFPREQNQQTLQ